MPVMSTTSGRVTFPRSWRMPCRWISVRSARGANCCSTWPPGCRPPRPRVSDTTTFAPRTSMKPSALLLIALPAGLAAQQPDLAATADSVFARWNSTHTPGCAVGVARGGKVLLTRGYGMADLETGEPITAETVFESGSVAKQFTATAVIMLALDGKLTLDDDARKYVPELPRYDRPITIRHLLPHTSGLREWSSLVAAAGWARGTRVHTQAELLDVVFRQRALNYPVGEYYSYTNSGYALAAAIVERVSGQSLQQFTQERIFGPLGMSHTHWRDDYTEVVPGRAQAYTDEDDGWYLAVPFENVVGPGGLLTTVGDWLTWNEALATGRPGGALVDSLTRRMRLNSGREIEYARGLFVLSYRGVPEISHSGSTAGYSTYLARFPDRDNLSIAVLCNSTGGAAGSYTHQLADRLIADFPPAPPLDTTRADPARLAPFAGIYRNTRTHAALEVNRGLAVRALPGDWYWLPNGTRWHFSAAAGAQPAELRIAQPAVDTVLYRRVADQYWQPTRAELSAFEGSYPSDEIGVTYQVKLAGDSLTLSPRAGALRILRPTYPDGFAMTGSAVWFTRDRGGRVTAMHLSESRMWDLVVPRAR
ncbi:MAG: beta-lactamase family protein [Gemmatimonadetes bacterium]|nr:beta-lactamase family protein [Gemmatimonadota bacterium]